MPSEKGKSKKTPRSGFVIGRSSFIKISSVEGLKETKAMKQRASDSKSKQLSNEEARQAIVRSHRQS